MKSRNIFIIIVAVAICACGGDGLNPSDGNDGGNNGGGVNPSSSAPEILSDYKTFCQQRERLLGRWKGVGSSAIEFGESGHLDGKLSLYKESLAAEYVITNSGTIRVKNNPVSIPIVGASPADPKDEKPQKPFDLDEYLTSNLNFSFGPTGDELTLSKEGQSETLTRVVEPLMLIDKPLNFLYYGNDFRSDGLCTESEYAVGTLAAPSECPDESLAGLWLNMLPTFGSRHSVDYIAFRPSNNESNPNRFKIGYMTTGDSSNTALDFVWGTYVLEGDVLTLTITTSEVPEIQRNSIKQYTVRVKPPYSLALNYEQEGELLLKRSPIQLLSVENHRELDGICEADPITTCPVSELLGVWKLAPYYQERLDDLQKYGLATIKPKADHFKISDDIEIHDASDLLAFYSNGTVKLFHAQDNPLSLYYEIAESCPNCEWWLKLATDSDSLDGADDFFDSYETRKIVVSSDTLAVSLGLDEDFEWIVFKKQFSFSSGGSIPECGAL